MSNRIALTGLALAMALGAAHQATADETAAWAALRAGGHVALMRHTDAPGGTGDPPGFKLEDCTTQRNLSDKGRKEAAQIGTRLTTADEVFVSGLGNDVLNGGGDPFFEEGSADAFQGAAGDDAIHVIGGNFKRADGGSGSDTLHLDHLGSVDLGNIDRDAATSDHTKIRNIETIDTDNGFATAIAVRLADMLDLDVHITDVGGVASLDNVLKIDGDTDDTLSLDPADGLSEPDTSTLAGYAIFAAGNVKIAVDQDISMAVA